MASSLVIWRILSEMPPAELLPHTLLPFALVEPNKGKSVGSVPVGFHVSRCCHLPHGLEGPEKERSHRNTVCRY